MKGPEHRDRFNGRQSERRRHVRGDSGESENLDVKLFPCCFDSLQIRARVMPETKLERMPHDRFPDLLAMGRELIADRSANKVRAVGIKAFLHQQVDVAEVDVPRLIVIFSVSLPRLRSLWTSAISFSISMDVNWMVFGWFSRVDKLHD